MFIIKYIKSYFCLKLQKKFSYVLVMWALQFKWKKCFMSNGCLHFAMLPAKIQRTLVKVLSNNTFIFTVMAWAYILVYVLYIFYGIIAEAYKLYIPSFFIYDKGVVVKTQGLFLALFKISIIEILILFVWMQYNYIRFSQKNRRHFAAPVLSDELKDYFELDSSTIDIMQNQKIILLKKNIIKEYLD